MKVAYYPKPLATQSTTLILGSFAVIHNGHNQLLKVARQFKKPLAIMIFADSTLMPKGYDQKLQSLTARLRTLALLDIAYVTVIRFDQKMQMMSGQAVLDQLIKITQARHIVMGKDFKMGHRGLYTAKAIAKDFPNTTIIDFVKVNQVKLSSSLMGELIALGDFTSWNAMAPLPYLEVVRVDEHYRVTSWTSQPIQPGIYACAIIVNDIRYWAAVHIQQNHHLQLVVPDLQIVNRQFEATIEFYAQIRTIVSSRKDEMLDHDIKQVATYLKNFEFKS